MTGVCVPINKSRPGRPAALRRRLSLRARPAGLGAGPPLACGLVGRHFALASPPVQLTRHRRRLAKRQYRHAMRNSVYFVLFFRHQRRPDGRKVGRLCCSSPASLFKVNQHRAGRIHARHPASRPAGALRAWSPHVLCSGSQAAWRPEDKPELQARRGFQRCSLYSTFRRGCRGPTLPARKLATDRS